MTKIILTLFVSVLFFSCQNESTPKLEVLQGNAFGTTYSLQYFSDDAFDAERGIDSVIYKVNRSVSTYMPKSDISKINNGDSTIVVDAIFKEVYRISETVYTNSKGFFDPTVGTLRNAYGFGDTEALNELDSLTLDSLMNYVGFRKVQLKADGTVSKQHREIYFDFNAIAKGYGIDLIGAYLEAQGVDNYVLELGGEVKAKGRQIAKGKPWIAGVESVSSGIGERSYRAKVSLENISMAASGNYRKFRVDSITGKKYVHTINPHTGKAEENTVTSVAVVAKTCALADAYATAFMAMGLENAKSLLPELDEIEAYITYTDANAVDGVYISEGFKKLLVD